MKILHVFRTPVGGLFRHVRDLARGQSELGHEVGIICDSTTGGKLLPICLIALRPIVRSGLSASGFPACLASAIFRLSRAHGSMPKNLALTSFMAMAPRVGFMAGWRRGRLAFLRFTRRMAAACITTGWRFPASFSWRPNGPSPVSAQE